MSLKNTKKLTKIAILSALSTSLSSIAVAVPDQSVQLWIENGIVMAWVY